MLPERISQLVITRMSATLIHHLLDVLLDGQDPGDDRGEVLALLVRQRHEVGVDLLAEARLNRVELSNDAPQQLKTVVVVNLRNDGLEFRL